MKGLDPEERELLKDFKKTFINAEIIEEEGEAAFNEGCLSIPDVREDVSRKLKITISYQDENFKVTPKHMKVLLLVLFNMSMII